MCYKQNVCPMYQASGTCEECLNCSYLKRARKAVLIARVGLAISIVAFIIITAMVW